MLNKRKKINLAIISVITLFVLTSVALAASYSGYEITGGNTEKNIDNETKDQMYDNKKSAEILKMDDNDITNAFAEQYGRTRKEILDLKAKLGNWKKVQNELQKFEESLTLKQTRIIELISMGYKLQDIDKAGEFALIYKIPPEDILKMKEDRITAKSKDSGLKVNSWDDVRWELDLKKSIRLADTNSITANEIEKKAKEQKLKKNDSTPKSQKNIEADLLKRSKITDSEISLCKKYGVADSMGCVFAKSLSKQYKVTLEKVLELKKDKGNWTAVKNELEVIDDEN